MPLEWAGTGGRVVAGYHHAADLQEWEIVRREEYLGDPVTVLAAKLANADSFWLASTDRLMKIKLNLGRCLWVWDTVEVQSLDPFIAWLVGEPRAE